MSISSAPLDITFYLAKLGQATSLLVNIAPLPTFLFCSLSHSEKVKRLDSISYIYLLTGLTTNIVWLAYGYKIGNQDIIVNNIFGMSMSIIIISMYMAVMKSIEQILMMLILIPIAIAFLINQVPVNLCGLVGSIISVTSNVSPLEKIANVIATRDHRFINFPVALFTCFNAVVWCTYGYITLDIFVFTCQFLNFNCGLIQVLFYFWAQKKISSENMVLRTLLGVFGFRKQDFLKKLGYKYEFQLQVFAIKGDQEEGEFKNCDGLEGEKLKEKSFKSSYDTLETQSDQSSFQNISINRDQSNQDSNSDEDEIEDQESGQSRDTFKMLGKNDIKIIL
ncbi:protein ruptured pollen grain [Stylonychia lemnae]|uniref:Protein ruptured pollen grain n=1 Tax=Stylonychia lemnae TaxID=5949 RepID=A0A078B4B3_STYLE|nr:protein ruptured pollen grain [Stylonychia lemnae]|eukprot:CDW89365.1 protein ruptured pollen grain [Stylonychia lemnae]